MKIIRKSRLSIDHLDAVVVPVFSGAGAETDMPELPGLPDLLKRHKMKGKSGESQVFRPLHPGPAWIVCGAGRPAAADDARKAARAAAVRLQELKATSAGILFPPAVPPPREYVYALLDALHLNTYAFLRYKKSEGARLERVEIAVKPAVCPATDLTALAAIDRAVSLVRDWVNEIPAVAHPDSMCAMFAELGREKGLAVEIMRRAELTAAGYNGLLAVGGASPYEPALVRIEYSPEGAQRTIAVVGKGITFDTGGLNLKTSSGMLEMKSDMAGAAVVAGIMQAAADLRLPCRLIGIAALAENMPGPGAYKPGDIIRYRNGKTVEINNTDAEGRLALADALLLAAEAGVDEIIEFSTLTGNMQMALGDGFAGLVCQQHALCERLLTAGRHSGERLWEMPFCEEYRESIKGKTADLKNSDYNNAGGIKAGIFLSEFTGKLPFAHLDIAGTAYLAKPNAFYAEAGASGFGVRLFLEYLGARSPH